VDLPEPEAPTMATISPASIVRLISLRTAMVPSPAGNSRRRSLSSSSACATSEPHAHASGAFCGLRRGWVGPGDDGFAGFQAFQNLDADVVVDADGHGP